MCILPGTALGFDGLSLRSPFDSGAGTLEFQTTKNRNAKNRNNAKQYVRGKGRSEGMKAEGTLIMAANDIDKARSTYDSFMGTLKWTVPLIAIITLFVVALIAP